MIVEFIREHADRREERDNGGLRWGVEPMCAVLAEHGIKISPSTYYEWIAKKPTRQQLRDADQGKQQQAHDGQAGQRQLWFLFH